MHDDDGLPLALPAEDRLWRHPSERAKHPFYDEQREYYDSLRRARRFVVATGAAVIGLSIATGLVLMSTMSDPRAPHHPAPAQIATVSVTSPSIVFVNAQH